MSHWKPDEWKQENTEKRMAVAQVAPKTEPELLAAIDQHEAGAREVYADWLEEQGDDERAFYVRAQDQIYALSDGPEREAMIERVKDLALKLDAAWRVLVARPFIRCCGQDGCPRDWGALSPSHTSDIRVCNNCQTRIEFKFHAARSEGPTVVDNVYDEVADWANTLEWRRRR